MDKEDKLPYLAGLLLIAALFIAIGFFNVGKDKVASDIVSVFFAAMFLLVVFTVIAGKAIENSWKGAFIDSRRKISLSRLQVMLWTALILPAIYAILIWNLGHADPVIPSKTVDIAIPGALLALMGISATSMVASPLVLSGKKGTPDGSSSNVLVTNKKNEEAGFMDLFMGEEEGNKDFLDMAKVQMFFFTVISLVVYGGAVYGLLADAGALLGPDGKTVLKMIPSLPEISDGLVTILGISHAGYLTHKAVPHTK